MVEESARLAILEKYESDSGNGRCVVSSNEAEDGAKSFPADFQQLSRRWLRSNHRLDVGGSCRRINGSNAVRMADYLAQNGLFLKPPNAVGA